MSAATVIELCKTPLLVQLLLGLKEISSISEQIRAFLGNNSATYTQLRNFGGVWLNDDTSGSVESRDECPTFITVSDVFAGIWKTRRSSIVSKCGWVVAYADLHWG